MGPIIFVHTWVKSVKRFLVPWCDIHKGFLYVRVECYRLWKRARVPSSDLQNCILKMCTFQSSSIQFFPIQKWPSSWSVRWNSTEYIQLCTYWGGVGWVNVHPLFSLTIINCILQTPKVRTMCWYCTRKSFRGYKKLSIMRVHASTVGVVVYTNISELCPRPS